MVNASSSKCKNCMVLIRMLVLLSLKLNLRVFAKHVLGRTNLAADALSRMNFKKFRKVTKNMERQPESLARELWPASKLWLK